MADKWKYVMKKFQRWVELFEIAHVFARPDFYVCILPEKILDIILR